MANDTTRARAELARRNAEYVLAEGALEGERQVAKVRIGLAVGRPVFVIVAAVAAGQASPAGIEMWGRLGVNLVYAGFAVGLWLILRNVPPDPKKSQRRPYLITSVDFFAILANDYLTAFYAPRGVLNALLLSAASAVLAVAFTGRRFGALQIAYATVLACVSHLLCAYWIGDLHAFSATFTCASFSILGALLIVFNLDTQRMLMRLRQRDALSRFLPEQVVNRMQELGELAFEPLKREATVLFSDIRDFTQLSETEDPRSLLTFLDEYFADMSQIVKGHDGMVNKFIGDGLMAVWGVPDRNEKHAVAAVRAAVDMHRKLAEINEQRQIQGKVPIRIGVGIHSGVVAAGMLGGAEQHEYTVIGDAVNVASRVEGLTKTFGCGVLVTERTWQLCGSSFRGQRVGDERVKGRNESVVVYRVDGINQAALEPIFSGEAAVAQSR